MGTRSAALVVLSAACAADEPPAMVHGNLAPVTTTFVEGAPVVEVRLNGGEIDRFFLATGSPLTVVNTLTHPGREAATWNDDLGVFAATFVDFPTTAWAVFPPGWDVDGMIGGDLLSQWAVTIDYRGARAWLGDVDVSFDLEAGAAVRVPIELGGGGTLGVPGCGGVCEEVTVPPLRVVVPVTIGGEDVWAIVDTGSPVTILENRLYEAVRGPSERIGVSSRTARVARASFGAAVVEDAPIMAIPEVELWDGLSAEVGRPIRALVGGSFLRRFVTTIDYPRRELVLAPYRSTDHIAADEHVGVGFRVERVGDGWRVSDVYRGSDAEARGVTLGHAVEVIAGVSVARLGRAELDALLGGLVVGTRVEVVTRGLDGPIAREILVEDLLP